MRAVAVYPNQREVRLIERADPQITAPTQVKLRTLEVGVCGTDKELCAFVYGTPPPGTDHFILGHESLAEVLETGPAVTGVRPGDLVVGSVRLPCSSDFCEPCRSDHQDFCATGAYREHGINRLDGYMAEYVIEDQRYLHLVPAELREIGVLVEPLTIAEKAWGEAACIQERLPWTPARRTALVLGAGPIGLLGAMKLIAEGYQTFLYSLLPEPNPGSIIAAAVGATYISSQEVSVADMAAHLGRIDLVYEALGAAQLAFDVLPHLAPNGLFIFTGVPRAEELQPFDTDTILTNLVLRNQAIVGIVNSGRSAFAAAIRDLGAFHRRWPGVLNQLITGRYPMEDFLAPVMGQAGGIKNVIQIAR
jgi:threonine dehydrogenase-like Zn-dependent dehydrogenase